MKMKNIETLRIPIGGFKKDGSDKSYECNIEIDDNLEIFEVPVNCKVVNKDRILIIKPQYNMPHPYYDNYPEGDYNFIVSANEKKGETVELIEEIEFDLDLTWLLDEKLGIDVEKYDNVYPLKIRSLFPNLIKETKNDIRTDIETWFRHNRIFSGIL